MAYQQLVNNLVGKNRVYHQADYVERHIESVLQFNPALIATTDTWTSNEGVASKLIVLRGTVPIEYRGITYHIPVDIWIPDAYPLQSPFVVVTPTSEMRVKPSHPFVEHSGHVHIPYLRVWNPTSATLVELVSMLSVEFSKEPPVYRYNPKQPQPSAIAHGQHFIRQSGVSPSYAVHNQSTTAEAEHLIREKLVAFVKDHTDYINELIAHQSEQKIGSDELKNGIKTLMRQKDLLKKYQIDLKARIVEIENWCHERTPAEPPSFQTLIETVEERITPADTWSRQMFEDAAIDFAIEDTLYVLDKFLQEDRIDLNTYLKKVRLLARDQFFARAVCIKVESKQKNQAMEQVQDMPVVAES